MSQGLAAGRCVVTGDHEAVRELLTPEAHAVLVPPADPVALADALPQLRDDSARRQALAAGGRALARRALTPEAVARQLLVALGARKIAQSVPAARAVRVAPTLAAPTAPAAPAGA